MPASDLSAVEIIKNFSAPYIQQRYRKDGVTEAYLYKLCRAISAGFHAETGQAIDDLEPQRFDHTAQQGFLDGRGFFWNVPRQPGENDAALRVRVGQVKFVKWGAFNVDEMLDILALLLNTSIDSIVPYENQDENDDWEPALIKFNIDPTVFTANGITDVPAAVASLESEMEEVAPAGVRVIITTGGTAQWDDGVTLWDDGKTWSA